MEVSYWMYGDDFKEHSAVLDKEQAIEIPIMAQKEMVWKKGEVMLYQEPMQGAEPMGLLGPFGEPYAQGKYYVKVLKVSPIIEEE